VFRPTNPSQLFVSNAHAGAGAGTISAFHDGVDGALTSIGASPYPDEQTAPCWVEISHDGRYLFASNTTSQTISSFRVNQDGTLALLGSTPLRDGMGAADARLSPDGRTLEVTGGSGHVLSSLAVNGGELTEIASSPVALPADSAPSGLVVN
jgi:6-phosphogluconolactonase (cycloisomerase 2 family)